MDNCPECQAAKISSVVLKLYSGRNGISEELPLDELDEYLPRFPLDLRVIFLQRKVSSVFQRVSHQSKLNLCYTMLTTHLKFMNQILNGVSEFKICLKRVIKLPGKILKSLGLP